MPNKTEQPESVAPVAVPTLPVEILTPQQVAERLQLPESWVYEQTRNRASVRGADPLPYMKVGRYLRFKWSDVLAWLDRQNRNQRATMNLDPIRRYAVFSCKPQLDTVPVMTNPDLSRRSLPDCYACKTSFS